MAFPDDQFASVGNAVTSGLNSGVSQLTASASSALSGVSRIGAQAFNGLLPGIFGAGSSSGASRLTEFDRAQARPDPLLNNSWDVLIVYKGIAINISDYVEEVQLPSVKLDAKAVFRNGTMKSYAKTESTGSLTIKLYETSDLIAYRFFRLWKNQVRDPQGNYGLPADYKGTIQLIPLDSNRSRSRVLEARGVFPISLPTYTFNSGQTERIVADVEMSCDELVPLSST